MYLFIRYSQQMKERVGMRLLLCAFCHVMSFADRLTVCCHVYKQENDRTPQPSFFLIQKFTTTSFFWFSFFFNWTFIEVKVAINVNKRPNILF